MYYLCARGACVCGDVCTQCMRVLVVPCLGLNPHSPPQVHIWHWWARTYSAVVIPSEGVVGSECVSELPSHAHDGDKVDHRATNNNIHL